MGQGCSLQLGEARSAATIAEQEIGLDGKIAVETE